MYDPYVIIIGASVLIIISYLYDIASKRFRAPSVLLLIFTGLVLKFVFSEWIDGHKSNVFGALELLGIIGLIMIVLEAAVDLKLSRAKLPLIAKSLSLALTTALLSSFGIAAALMHLLDEPFLNSIIYAIPLSVVSSAVLIPSIRSLSEEKREFMIYESTFSDIVGIMLFNFVVLYGGAFFLSGPLCNIALTLLVSFAASYMLVYLFGKLSGGARLFLMIAILALLYALSKALHLSSLLIILVFGLMLNNARVFFRGGLAGLINTEKLESIAADFKTLTVETAFIVRTFFFVVFGVSIELSMLLDFTVVAVGLIIVVILYLIRFVNLRLFQKTAVFPELFLAPRGLITILLFFSIPAANMIDDFSVGILFFVILATNIIMMVALMKFKDEDIVDLTHGPSEGFVRFRLTPKDAGEAESLQKPE